MGVYLLEVVGVVLLLLLVVVGVLVCLLWVRLEFWLFLKVGKEVVGVVWVVVFVIGVGGVLMVLVGVIGVLLDVVVFDMIYVFYG